MIRQTNEQTAHESADRALEQRVRTYLGTFSIPSLRRLGIEAREGTVTLRGRVATYYEKQLSYQCPRYVDGIHKLVDLITVKQRDQ